jgi:HK97 family phage major capsid protein
MATIATLEQEFEAKRQEGLALYDKYARAADAEGNRLLTDAERADIERINAECRDLEAQLDRVTGDRDLIHQLERVTGTSRGLSVGVMRRGLSIGAQFVQSEAYNFVRKHLHRQQAQWSTPSFEFLAETITSDPASGGKLLVPQYQPGILPLPVQPPTVADLFAQGTTSSTSIVYMRESVFTNAAAAVLEGAAKPESTLRFDSATDPVRKLAHWIPISEEMLEDEPQIRSYVDARLTFGLKLEEDDQVLNGDGIAPNILGLKNRVGLTATLARVDPATNADVLFQQSMTVYAASLLMPDAYILHPANWNGIVLSKTSTGEYLAGGPFAGSVAAANLWGLPVVVTPNQPQGTGWVGAFKTGGQIFRHGGIRIDATNSHADFFVKNLVAIRAEERIALAVYRPSAFGQVSDLTPAVV